MGGGRVARDTQVPASLAHRRDRDQRGPQIEPEGLAHPHHRLGQHRLDRVAMFGWDEKGRTVTAEDERQVGAWKGVLHGRDQGGAGDVDRSIAPILNGPGRHHHVAQGDPPCVRHRDVTGFVEDVGKSCETWHVGVAKRN